MDRERASQVSWSLLQRPLCGKVGEEEVLRLLKCDQHLYTSGCISEVIRSQLRPGALVHKYRSRGSVEM